MKKLGAYIRMKRKAARLSQRELGELLGVSSQFICNIERQGAPMPYARLQLLAQALGIEPAELGQVILEDVCTELRAALCLKDEIPEPRAA
jgi:transcriptional regulator with XRE-family HTH domain